MNYTQKRTISHGVLDPNIVVEIDGRLYRKIAPVRAWNKQRWRLTGQFMQSPDLDRLIEKQLVIPRSKMPCSFDGCDHYETDRVPFVTHLLQWTSEQFAAVVELTCRVNLELMKMKSKFRAIDCHYFNVLFLHYRPIYIDFGSFSDKGHEGIWTHIQMSLRARGWDESICPMGADLEEVIEKVKGLIPEEGKTKWDNYGGSPLGPETVSEINSNTEEEELIYRWMKMCRPSSVVDIGANTGTFSRLIASLGINVLAVDVSEKATNQNWKESRRLDLPITCVCADIQKPDDAHKGDMVFASSVTHHMIRSGLSFKRQAEIWNHIAGRFLAVEFIDPSDKCLEKWEKIPDYSKASFLNSIKKDWRIMGTASPQVKERIWYFLARV